MKTRLDFLLFQSLQYMQSNQFEGVILLLKQVLRAEPKHFQALRLMAVALAKKNLNIEALDYIDKAIAVNKKDGIAHSNKGNILRSLGRNAEAIVAYGRAIELAPNYAEAYGNLANAYQDQFDYESALASFQKAINKDSVNPDFYCNLGNCLLAINKENDATLAYKKAIELQPNHADAHYFLSQLNLRRLEFIQGWKGSEWRWLSRDFNSPPLETRKNRWDGSKTTKPLLVWAEQGIGDQILYASMISEVQKIAPNLIVSLDNRLISIFERSFPNCRFIDKLSILPSHEYDYQIPIGSIGQFMRNKVEDFVLAPRGYLKPKMSAVEMFKDNQSFTNKIKCGISWKSSNPSVGSKKSINLEEMRPIFELKDKFEFINLQYGDTGCEQENIKNTLGVALNNIENVDLFNDIESLAALILANDLIITTSNSTAHFAGALGAETLLLLPFSAGKFWYWHDIDTVSLWYPSIKVFKQHRPGDWSQPIQSVKAYLEDRFGV